MIKPAVLNIYPVHFPPRQNLVKAKTIQIIRFSTYGLPFKYMTDVAPIAKNTVLFTVKYLNQSIKDCIKSYPCSYSYVFYNNFISEF